MLESSKIDIEDEIHVPDLDDGRMKETENLLNTDTKEDGDEIEIIKQISCFDRPASEMPLAFQLKMITTMVYDISMMTLTLSGNVLVKSSGFLYFNIVGDPILQASYGLHCFLTVAIHDGLVIANLEKLGIRLSEAYGSGDFKECKNIVSKSILTALLLLIFVTVPLSLMTENIMLLIGLNPAYARLNQDAMYWSLPMFAIYWMSEITKTFCIAQGRERAIQVGCFTSTVICIALNYFFIVRLQLGLKGIVATKTVGPILELIVAGWEYAKCKDLTLGLVNFTEVIRGYKSFAVDSLKFMISMYAEVIGYEITGLFVAVNCDSDQTAAFYAAANIPVIAWVISAAISTVCRTRINILIGMKKFETAKNFYYYYLTIIEFIAILFGILVFFTRSFLSRLLANSTPEMNRLYTMMMMIYAFELPFDLVQGTLQLGLKSLGKIKTVLTITMTGALLLNTLGCIVLQYLNHNAVSYFALMSSFTVAIVVSLFICLLLSDWSKADKA